MTTRRSIDWNRVKSRLQESQALLEQSLVAVEGAGLEQIYCQRARAFAARTATAVEPLDARLALTFTVETERLCLDLALVAEILPFAKCSPIAGASPELLGVTNVRGRICSVLDLARILQLPKAGDRERGYIVLVRHAGLLVGMRADRVDQIQAIPRTKLEFQDGDLVSLSPQYVRSRTEDRIAVLDVEAILSHPVFLPSLKPGRVASAGLNVGSRATRVAAAEFSERISTGGSLK
ncbi:MAG TPA: chemotaxis protein CheW [Pirellulales bacterium]|jgi:purine-binding chemotaxis protein CheW|nr:chemotaxis protein CheW [Pirellulales bacterium]